MADDLILYTCEIDDGGAKIHPCRRAHDALREAGHEYETVIMDRNRPLGSSGSAVRRSCRC